MGSRDEGYFVFLSAFIVDAQRLYETVLAIFPGFDFLIMRSQHCIRAFFLALPLVVSALEPVAVDSVELKLPVCRLGFQRYRHRIFRGGRWRRIARGDFQAVPINVMALS